MKTADFVGNVFKISFSYDPATVAQVRCLPPGRKWVPEIKAWTCPPSTDALEQLRTWGFAIAPDLLAWEQEVNKKKTIHPVKDVPGLKCMLRPFQAEGVGWLNAHDGVGLIGDEMGLGKTIQALAYAQLHPELWPVLVVCPASLKLNWERETLDKFSLRPFVISGRATDVPTGYDVYIINYDIALQRTIIKDSGGDKKKDKKIIEIEPRLKALNPKVVILDECHYIKNSKADRTKALRKLCHGRRIIALSGTPIVNRPVEFFNTLNLLDPVTFGSFWTYAMEYCGATHNGYGWDFRGVSNPEKLHAMVSNVMIRRKKEDVLKELPAKQRSVVSLEIHQPSYQAALRECQLTLTDAEPGSVVEIGAISSLRQAVMQGKIENAIEWLGDFRDSGRQLVCFYVHHKTGDTLGHYFKENYVDGRMNQRVRQDVVDRFTKGEYQILFGSIDVLGTGWNLQAASDVAFVELPWVPGILDQAEDRVHRIGQRDAVNVYYLLAQDTIEDDMMELLDAKRKVLSAVLDGKEPDSGNIFSELIKRIKGKERE